MLYILKVYSDEGLLFLNKTGKKDEQGEGIQTSGEKYAIDSRLTGQKRVSVMEQKQKAGEKQQ